MRCLNPKEKNLSCVPSLFCGTCRGAHSHPDVPIQPFPSSPSHPAISIQAFPFRHSHPARLLLSRRICFLCRHPVSAWLKCCTKCSAADSSQHFTGHLASTGLPLSKGSSPALLLPSGQLHPHGHTPLEPSLYPRVALMVFTPSLASKFS